MGDSMTQAPRRRRFTFSLRSMFIVVTAVAVCLGWNVRVVQHRKTLWKQITAEREHRAEVLTPFGSHYFYKQDYVQHAPKDVSSLSFIRRFFGDELHRGPILRNTKVEAMDTKVWFPECDISYYAGHYYVDDGNQSRGIRAKINKAFEQKPGP